MRPARLSSNVIIVATGLATVGLGSLALLAIVSRSLESEGFAQFGVWFGMANVLSFGLFVPLETAITRAMLASDTSTHHRMWLQAVTYTAAVLIGTLVVGIAFRSEVLPRLMADSWPLVPVTMAYLSVLALQAIQRGAAVGRDRFWPLLWQFGTDGALRLILPGIIVSFAWVSPSVFALCVTASAACGLAAGQMALSRVAYRTPAPAEETGSDPAVGLDLAGLGALVVAAVGAQLLANGAPPILGLLDRDPPIVLAGVVGALSLTRMPLLFASAIQAPLLPPMVRLVRAGDTHELWKLLRRILGAFAVLCVAAWFMGWYLGTLVLRLYLGHDYGVSHASMALLTSAGMGLLAVVAVQAAVVSVGANSVLAMSWGTGIVTFLSIMAIPASGLVIAPIAIALGTTVTLCSMMLGLRIFTAAHVDSEGVV